MTGVKQHIHEYMVQCSKLFHSIVSSGFILQDILIIKVFQTKDDPYHNLKHIINDKTLALASGIKYLCLVITERAGYIPKLLVITERAGFIPKLQAMIDHGITGGV